MTDAEYEYVSDDWDRNLECPICRQVEALPQIVTTAS